MIYQAIIKGILSAAALLILYFIILALISGWPFAFNQFKQDWYWLLGLPLLFGVQMTLFFHLRAKHHELVSAKMVATSGATSGIAMVACCAHYLINFLPWLGLAGLLTIIGQYQPLFFSVGLIVNLLGISYLSYKLINLTKIKKYEKQDNFIN